MAKSAAAEVVRLAREIYGEPTNRVQGVLHCVSASERVDGRLHVIAIGPAAPKSETDFFVLNYWRAHSDAILTTAAIVRAEPRLSHTLQGRYAAELRSYRAEVAQRSAPPICLILSRSGELPPEHPLFSDPLRNVVLTVPERAAHLRALLGARAEVIGQSDLDARTAIDWLRGQGARTILIEAGPSAVSALYEAPNRVDRLLLSRFDGELDPAAVGGALPAPARLFEHLSRRSESFRQEPSGTWCFQHWQRDA
jgi:riboflavin biosynthesis pyrimidine reductase